tara:strand:- start:970 stop:3087 length:2118 start_codon:yes stop_codon:yes gene_type:complete
MKNSFTNKQTNLDLNGPYLSFDSEPQSVTGIGTKVGGTTGATVTLTGISTAGFSTDRPTVFNPPCVSVIDENDGGNVDNQWIGFTSAHPARQFNLMRVPSGYAGLGTPSSNLPGVAEYFRMYDVNRDNGMTTSRSDWYELAGFESIANSGALISLWIDTSGSMTMSSVQASYDLFIEKCNSAGISVETTTGYGENYIGAFVDELTGLTPPANKGSVDYRWHEVGVGPLSDSANVTGTATTTLTLSNLITPTDNGREFFLQVDYDPQTAVGIGSMKITGNAPNEPFNSGISTVTVTPLVEITTQPVATSTFPNVATDITVVASLTDSSFTDDIQYQWQMDGLDVSDGIITKSNVVTEVSGATTPTLTLTSNNSGISYNVRCVVSSATASNSLIVSDSVIYTVNVPTNTINIESIKNAGTLATLSSVDLDTGDITINAATSSTAADFFLYSLYAPNKDVDVEMDLYGGKGDTVGANQGGEGGFSRIRFTMEQNEEYVIAGLIEAIKTPFVYHKASLIACVGGGGNAGTGGSGGDGGGIGVGGAAGLGVDAGREGDSFLAGTLPSDGIFGSSYQSPLLYPGDQQRVSGSGDRGRTIKCTKGVYWAQQGIGACTDVSVSGKFRISDGTEITNTASIERGYKAGYNIIQTAGSITTAAGANGGNGLEGGGGAGNGGAGGGSGYTDGSVTVVSTQQGGSTGNAKVIIRLQT